jgi:hypothetical protein
VTCTCCVCAGLPLTRGFDSIGPGTFDPTTTKTVTWADSFQDANGGIVDGYGPIQMQGRSGWQSFVGGLWLSGSSVTFTKVDGPGLSLGTYLFPGLWTVERTESVTTPPQPINPGGAQANPGATATAITTGPTETPETTIVITYPAEPIIYPDEAKLSSTPKSGSVTASLYGVSLKLSYSLTLDELDDSVSNAVYVDKGGVGDPPFTASAVIGQQIQSLTFTDSGVFASVLDVSTTAMGTSLEEFTERPLDGLKDLFCWREAFPGTNQAKWNLQREQLGGASQTPPITSGYTISHTLEFNGETRLLLPEGSGPRPAWPYPVSLSFVCDGQPTDEELPTSGYWTAAAFRPALFGGSGLGNQSTYLKLGVTGPGHVVGMTRILGPNEDQSTDSGMMFAISRDGTPVLPPTQAPTRQQLFDATQEDGSYLVTVTPIGTYSHAFPNPQLPTNKDFFSFVVDRKKPVVGFTPLDDQFVGRPISSIAPYWGQTVVMSTKPFSQAMNDESPGGVMTRPFFQQMELRPSGGGLNPYDIGTFTIRPVGAADVRDLANNAPDQIFSQAWTVHAIDARATLTQGEISHTYFGAIPKIHHPVLETREYFRPRSQAEQISSLILTFDRPVDPETVEDSQVRLYCNGALTAGCTIEQADATTMKWRIIVPSEVQQSATFCLLEYDPAGEVMTAETFEELHYPTKKDFPKSSTRLAELFRKVLVSDDDDKRFSISLPLWPDPFVEIGNGNPLDYNGNPYDPEPSVIVARTSWLMADVDGWPRKIDTSAKQHSGIIGRAASIGAIKAIDTTQNNLTITSAGDIGIAAESSPGAFNFIGTIVPAPVQPQQDFTDFGLVTTSVNYESFIPRMPTTGATGPFSYWGLGTTIDPSPPALVSQCAGPSEAQWHSSAIVCDTEITGFTARIVILDGDGNEIEPTETGGGYIEDKLVFNGAAPGDFNHVATDLFPRIMCLDSPPAITLGTTFKGTTLSQNVWACVNDGGGTEITAYPQATSSAYFLDGESFTESNHWLDDTPYFLRHFDSEDREYGDSETTEEDAKDGLRFTEEGLLTDGPFPFSETELQRKVRCVKSATYSLEGVQGMLTASRQAKTFPALKTTTLGPLVLTLSLRACIKAETEYEDFSVKPTEHVRLVGEPSIWGGPDYIYQENMTFSAAMDWLTDNLIGLDAEEDTWKLRPLRWLMYCEKDESLATRTLTERILNDYVYTHILTPDQEVALANGDEITMPLGGVNGYSVKLQRS